MNQSHGHCPKCHAVVEGVHRFCPTCGAELSEVVLSPTAQASTPPPQQQRQPVNPPAPAAAAPAPPLVYVVQGVPAPMAQAPVAPSQPGRAHSPLLALLLALLIPGAGQAYNGRPVRGFFVLFLTPLVIPWLLSLWGAWATASEIRKTGGRYGKGGVIWVFLQLWLVCNVALLTLIILTTQGVLQ